MCLPHRPYMTQKNHLTVCHIFILQKNKVGFLLNFLPWCQVFCGFKEWTL